MTRKSSLSWICGAAATLLMASGVQAQGGPPPYAAGGPPPGFQGAPMGAPGAPGQAGDPNAISNVDAVSTTTTTTQFVQDDVETLPNTGGAPLLMALAGSALASGAFFLRRRLS